ncbi:PulJ/GspJ family protein [Flavobacterium sp.]|uniref:PulJ/GspJ family protein n=2 Tax=Flavobacterium sp. TaxID=239 RepID=UPI0040486FB8
MNKKINSFTLSEMLVVLIITSIVVGIAFSVLNLVRKQVAKLQSETDKNIQYDLLKNRITFDFYKFNDICVLDNNQVLFKNEMDSSFYEFKDNLLIVKQDTLVKNLKEVKFWRNNKEVNEGKIDAVNLVIEEKKDVFRSVFVYKNNDATNCNDIDLNGF